MGKHKKLFSRKRVEDTGQYYDPTATYGRKKKEEYADTKKGRFDAQANKEDYYQWLMGEAGALDGATPLYGGPTPFGQWLATSNFDNLQTGYNAARMQSGGRLEFRDYMKSAGYTQKGLQNATTAVSKTGNPFTESSYGVPSMKNWLGRQDLPKPFQQLNDHRQDDLRDQYHTKFDAKLPSPAWQDAQRRYLSLLPGQRGASTPAYGYTPGRWAVF